MSWNIHAKDAHPTLHALWNRLSSLSLCERRQELLNVMKEERAHFNNAASFVLLIRILLEELGYEPLSLARGANVSVPTIFRYAEGTSTPHALVRSGMLTAYTKFVREHQ